MACGCYSLENLLFPLFPYVSIRPGLNRYNEHNATQGHKRGQAVLSCEIRYNPAIWSPEGSTRKYLFSCLYCRIIWGRCKGYIMRLFFMVFSRTRGTILNAVMIVPFPHPLTPIRARYPLRLPSRPLVILYALPLAPLCYPLRLYARPIPCPPV